MTAASQKRGVQKNVCKGDVSGKLRRWPLQTTFHIQYAVFIKNTTNNEGAEWTTKFGGLKAGEAAGRNLSIAARGGIGGAEVAANAVKAGTNAVYQGVDAAGVARYVGITERLPQTRFAEHINSFGTGKELLRYDVIDGATNLTRTQARVWEQTLINQYGLQKNGGLLINKINSIAPKSWMQFGIK